MTAQPPSLHLERFLADVPVASIAGELAMELEMPVADIEFALVSMMNEARVAWRMIEPMLGPGMRVLEVGAGLCLTSLFLRSQGIDVIALEPASGGFDLFARMRRSVLAHYRDLGLTVLERPADSLDAGRDGVFDLIFSNNVIEHIPDWQAALDAMLGVLAAQGQMVHGCPNYRIPYEPHFGVPLFGPKGRWSRRWFASRITGMDLPWVASGEALWGSLNFITAGDVRRYASARRLRLEFEGGLLYRSLKRLEHDPWFRQRHTGSAIMRAYRLLKASGGLALIRRLPPAWITPMVFHLSRGAG